MGRKMIEHKMGEGEYEDWEKGKERRRKQEEYSIEYKYMYV
jgi:hypothetical protein